MSRPATIAATARSERREQTDLLAGRLATVGAALGMLAGVVDVAVGSSIRSWIGNKLNPTPLGLLTVILSAVAFTGAIRWQRPGGREGDRRLATVLTFLLPAGVCFTTIGRLWYVPGVLLLAAGVLVAGASKRDELSHAISRRHWLSGTTALLGAYYLFLGGDTLPKGAGALGVLGALSIWAALLTSRRPIAVSRGLLVVGALPFAVATWWSIATPPIALLVLLVGWKAINATRPDALLGRGLRHQASSTAPAI